MNVAGNVQHTGGEVIARPAGEEISSANADKDVQASALSLRMFLRRSGDEAILTEESFLDGLKKFKRLPLGEQRRKM